jgi:prepilin-type N-terminal cleavage/methylation domain-containing protein
MCIQRTPLYRRAFTLIEMLVVIAIILVLAALAAAFMPRVQDSTKLTSGIDQLEQWLLTAKMRAKRDGLATGIRLIADANNPGMYSQAQYVQQPDPLSGGWLSITQTPGSVVYSSGTPPVYLNGGICLPTPNLTATPPIPAGHVQFANVDFTLGGTGLLVLPGDYLEIRDSGVYLIGPTVQAPYNPANTLQLGSLVATTYFSTPWPSSASPQVWQSTYEQSLSLTAPTTNYRILRQPRPILGENPLQLPGNLAVDLNVVPSPPSTSTTPFTYSHVAAGPTGQIDILFSPSGAVVGANAGLGKVFLYVHDMSLLATDPNFADRSGIVAVQTLTGFIGAYNSGAPTTQLNMYQYANQGRGSGL